MTLDPKEEGRVEKDRGNKTRVERYPGSRPHRIVPGDDSPSGPVLLHSVGHTEALSEVVTSGMFHLKRKGLEGRVPISSLFFFFFGIVIVSL